MKLKTFNTVTVAELTSAKWSSGMISLLEQNYLQRSDFYLATALGVKICDVRDQLRTLGLDRRNKNKADRTPQKAAVKQKHQRIRGTNAINKKAKKETVRERIVMSKQHQQIEKALEANRQRRNKPLFKERVVDYTQLITVRIDRKTVIYAKPGQDIEKLKASFLKTYSKSMLINKIKE